MAGTAEGVWLDSSSIHPFATGCTIGENRFI